MVNKNITNLRATNMEESSIEVFHCYVLFSELKAVVQQLSENSDEDAINFPSMLFCFLIMIDYIKHLGQRPSSSSTTTK